MNYDLAKQLKDARFPQVADDEGTLRKGGDYLFPDLFKLSNSQKEFEAAVAYAPTLSELIEACGDRFFSLRNEEGWLAKGFKAPGYSVALMGSTPEEAVAKLWLALNEKK